MKLTKSRCVITLLVLFALCFALSACGDSSDNSATLVSTPEVVVIDEPEPDELESNELDLEDTDKIVADETEGIEAGDEVDQDELNGIVILEADLTVNHPTFDIFTIDSITAEMREVASFCITMAARDDISYFYEQASFMARYGNYKDMFSPDYSKMVVTIYDSTKVAGKQEQHAGWIDQSGNIFDLTQALGIESDYVTTIKHASVGFMDENTFVYVDRSNDEHIYYAVPLDNIQTEAVVQMDPNDIYIHDITKSSLAFMNSQPPTYWIDDTHYYGNGYWIRHHAHSIIMDITTGTSTNLVSVDDNHMTFWSPVPSPDQEHLALIAHRDTGGGVADLVLMNIESGEINLVCNLKDATMNSGSMISSDINVGDFCYAILDWK